MAGTGLAMTWEGATQDGAMPVNTHRVKSTRSAGPRGIPVPVDARPGTTRGRYATALITLVSFSTISPICSSVMMSGGERAMVSPVTRIIRPKSAKARSMAS